MSFLDCMAEPMWPWLLVISWYIQMGIHEGSHAEVAYRLGDDTASLLGKRTFVPLAHIEFGTPMGLLGAVVLPFFSVFGLGSFVALGMAWVPINPMRFRDLYRDHALVALAGPMSNFALCAVCLAAHHWVLPLFPTDNLTYVGIECLFAALYSTSLIYGIFNLVPIPPLDGSVVLYWLARPLRSLIDTIRPWGFYILIIMFNLIPEVRVAFFTTYALLMELYD